MTLWRKCKGLLIPALILITGLGLAGASAEQKQLNEWQYSKEIIVKGSETYKFFYLDEYVYEHSLSHLVDLRILDDKGDVVPYYIQSGYLDQSQSEIVYESNVVRTARKDNHTIIDFQIIPVDQNTDIIGNELVFTLPNEDFLKHIVVEGSYDGNQWTLVTKDQVYRTDHLEKRNISLEDIYKYSFYRITIQDNVENITLQDLALHHNQHETEWRTYQKSVEPKHTVTTEEKNTIIEVKNPQHLKINKIGLEINENFQRAYRVYNEENQELYSDTNELYNLDFTNTKISNTSISFSKQPISSGLITIKISNQDNPPLKINKIVADYYVDKLVFKDTGSSSYTLYYGNPDATEPFYELEQFKSHIEKEAQDTVTLGDQIQINSKVGEDKISWINMKVVFNIVIVLVSILLVLFLARKLNSKQ